MKMDSTNALMYFSQMINFSLDEIWDGASTSATTLVKRYYNTNKRRQSPLMRTRKK
jgi:hypothetical protein